MSVSITTISTAASKSGIKIDTTRPITGGITSGGTGGELIDEGNFLQAGGEDNISSSAGTAAPITNQTTPAKPISWPLTIDQVMSQYSVSEEVVRKEILEVMKLQESRSAFYV